MKANVVGPSARQKSLDLDAQRTINMYAVVDQDGKEPAALYSRPGNKLLGVTGSGPGRGGLLAVGNNRAFVVSGGQLFEEFSDGTSNVLGSLSTTAGIVTMAENGFQLAVCDGTSLYIFTYATNAFIKVSNPNLPSASTVTFLGGYFIISQSPTSGIFQISAPYDGTSWAALDFATAESSPDALLIVLNINGQLALVGSYTTEFWTNTGAAAFPFQRTNNAAILSVGTIAPYSALLLDNTLYMIGRDINGYGIVYKADGYTPVRVSTDPMELRIQAAPDPASLRSFSYQDGGHTFLIITGGGMETALVLDLATQLWTEWAYLNSTGTYELPLTSFLFSAFNKIIALDKTNGNVYVQSGDVYSDNGTEIVRDRTFTHIFNMSKRFRLKNLAVNVETGVGNNISPGANPMCELYISSDGGKTFGNPQVQPIGRIGQYMERGVMFWRLGSYFMATFRFRITASVKVAIVGGNFNI